MRTPWKKYHDKKRFAAEVADRMLYGPDDDPIIVELSDDEAAGKSDSVLRTP
jgi:hypothetical protein